MDRLGGTFGSQDFSEEEDQDFGEDEHDLEPPPSPVGQDERRMQVRAYNHWAGLLGNRNLPSIEDLEPETLDDFGPHSVLLDFTAGAEDPAIQYLGAKLANECGAEDEIEHLSDVPARSLLSRITDHYMQILANQAPIGFEAEFVNQRGQAIMYRGILLPYSSDNDTIDFVYGVISWKELADQETAEELLLEIGQALEADEKSEGADALPEASEETLEPSEALVEADAGEPVWSEGEEVLDLAASAQFLDDAPVELPTPAFGAAAVRSEPANDAAELGDEIDWNEDIVPPADAAEPADDDELWDEDEDEETGYGLGDFEEEPEYEDVDELVDPLADESVGLGLSSLVTRRDKPKRMVELPGAFDEEDEPLAHPAVAESYEPELSPAPFEAVPVPGNEYEPDWLGDEEEGTEHTETAEATPAANVEPPEAVEGLAEEAQVGATAAPVENFAAEEADFVARETGETAEGLYDCLAAARELAQVARSSEDRSRKALYQAVGRAYDFSLQAAENPEEFEELVAENGLTVQERAPMTPVVKLVFGADYDKTRLTEYATVLGHAHRVGIGRGALCGFLREAEGGLKGVVEAERSIRREEEGKPVEQAGEVKSSVAKKLRRIEPIAFEELGADGHEFALVMIRRTPEGGIAVLGELPEDIKALERAGRSLLRNA